MNTLLPITFAFMVSGAAIAAEPVTFNARTARSGNWSDAKTWADGRAPRAGDFVQIRANHTVTYDVESKDSLRLVHVAGTLTFSREKSTWMEVGLIKIQPGDTTSEDGFNCHEAVPEPPAEGPFPALEIGTRASPIPDNVTATIRLRHFKGTDVETLPAIVACGGRWDVHGSPLKRTWLKLATSSKVGDARVILEQTVPDWRIGDRVIVTTGDAANVASGHSFQKRPFAIQKPVGTEERSIAAIDGAAITLDAPLKKVHRGDETGRSEVANLSRNVIIESADPGGVRGHTMYHHGSSGGISYAEIRHLGKDSALGKYPIHFHLVRGTMRGSGVTGASVWDSHNRWVTVHGTDHLLIRDCVGYQSRGHGYFLEDATEQWNVFDRNLAVQSFGATPLPKQLLPYDPNDGAGFWWANGRNTFTRNVACENDHYGYHYHLAKTPQFDPVLRLRGPDGKSFACDVRTIPFLRFEDNESHGNGLFGFRFGDEEHGSVRSDREHPFVAKNLLARDEHYAVRPNLSHFLLDGLRVRNAGFGIYHPSNDAHVYRDIELTSITAEPIHGGHDEESFPHGSFTYDRLTLKNCSLKSDPLVQLTRNGQKPDLFGHFRGLAIVNSRSASGGIVDFGGGPKSNRLDNPVAYFFHDTPAKGTVTRIASERIVAAKSESSYREIKGWTGSESRATELKGVAFPDLLSPLDDLPPATLITKITVDGSRRTVEGVAHDNGEVTAVWVNGQAAKIVSQHAGVAYWTVTLDAPTDGRYRALSKDRARNEELTPHETQLHPQR